MGGAGTAESDAGFVLFVHRSLPIRSRESRPHLMALRLLLVRGDPGLHEGLGRGLLSRGQNLLSVQCFPFHLLSPSFSYGKSPAFPVTTFNPASAGHAPFPPIRHRLITLDVQGMIYKGVGA